LRNYNQGIQICIGTNANFAQINEQKPSLENCDMVCYSIHPQEHASDNTTLLENLQAQSYTVISAKQFAEGKRIWVSPVNIQRRFNANIENFEAVSSGDKIPPQVDSRMMSLFGACWTAGSIKYLGESGVDGITYYETAGERGIIQGNSKTIWPDLFRSSPGSIFPAFHIFRWLLSDKSFSIIKSTSNNPLTADILTLFNGSRIKMAIFNPWNETRIVHLTGLIESFSGVCLETETFEASGSDPSWIFNASRAEIKVSQPLTLNPYSITFLEGTINGN
jgi:D-apionolactonase